MRPFSTLLILVAAGILSGCAEHRGIEVSKAEITYFDRNGDGRVDLEKRQYPGTSDADSELRDDDYDGRYEKKILYGFAVKETAVDIPVPTDVEIEKTP